MAHAPLQKPHVHDMILSKRSLAIAGSMAIFALAMATVGVLFGLTTPGTEGQPVIAERTLTFEELDHGVVRVRDATSAAEMAVLGEDKSGFVRNVLRGFAYQRRLQSVSASEPFILQRFDQRRLAMVDTATGVRYNLYGHGQRNMQAFQALVPMPTRAETAH